MLRWQERQVLAFVVLLVVFIEGLLKGEWHPWVLGLSGLASLALLAVMWWWDSFLWRSRLAQKLPWVPKDIRGVWKGTLASYWKDPQTDQRIPAKDTYLVIRQTASQVHATLMTDESKSKSSAARLILEGGAVHLNYLYLNQPRLPLRSHSPIHWGATSLAVAGQPRVTSLEGHYWTDRDTKGELTFHARRTAFPETYQDAHVLF